MTKEAKTYNKEKTAFSINGKTEELYARESNWITFSHHIQK